MAQLVQFQQGVVEVLEFEVGGQKAPRHVVRRVLDGAEIVDFVGVGHHHHAAGVLAGGPLDAGAAQGQPVFLGVIDGAAPLLQVLFHIAVGGFVLDARDGARLKDVGLAEEFLGVAVDAALVFPREVQVDIRLLVAVEAQEGLEGDVVAVHDHPGAADRAVLVRQVEAVVHAAVGDELAVLALGTAVMGRQAVDLRDAREVGHGGGTDRATAAHLVAAGVGVGHQLDRDDVQNRVAVAADGVQLLLQPLPDDVRQGVAVVLFGPLPGGVPQLLFGALDAGGVGPPGDGPDGAVDGRRDLVGVFHHDFVGFFLGQVAELGQHVLGGAVVEGRLEVGVLEAVARLEHRAVDGVLRLLEVDVAGGDDRLVQVLAQPDHRPVELFDGFVAGDPALPDHILVVAQGLDFQNVVVGSDLLELLIRAPLHNGPVELPCLAGRGQQQSLPVLVQQAPGHPGLFEEVGHMGLADDLIEVFQAHLVLHQDDEVVIFLFQDLPVAAKAGVDLAGAGDLLFFQVLEHDAEDPSQGPRVLAGPVGLVVGQLQVLVDGSLLIVGKPRVHGLGHGQGVDIAQVQLDAAAAGRRL